MNLRFAIHTVEGHMPGLMNVLLAEAVVPYDKLVEMEEINTEFPMADIALVIGANYVVNSAARNNPNSPIVGMPILNAHLARTVMVVKRSRNPGFAGIDYDLYHLENTLVLFGDAKIFVEIVKQRGAIPTPHTATRQSPKTRNPDSPT